MNLTSGSKFARKAYVIGNIPLHQEKCVLSPLRDNKGRWNPAIELDILSKSSIAKKGSLSFYQL